MILSDLNTGKAPAAPSSHGNTDKAPSTPYLNGNTSKASAVPCPHGNKKPARLAVGMMSGTSVDGIDAALVEISGSVERPQVRLLAFENKPFPPDVRRQIFELFRPETSTVDRIGYMNFLLGELYADAALSVIRKAGHRPEEIDVIGSHGQTIWHEPIPCTKDGYPVSYTVQIGEGAVIAERTGILTVTDFRVTDMAAGGQGAPLVPFSEYLLYRRENETILLQNIGGIGNMTVLPAAAGPEDVYAFDTGPGNMIIDAAVSALTGGVKSYDAGGEMAAQGSVNQELLALLQKDKYYTLPLPKSTGRERFGLQYTQKILDWCQGRGRKLSFDAVASPGTANSHPQPDAAEHSAAGDQPHLETTAISPADLLATVTDLTAWSIADAYERYVLPKYHASELIVGGGGSYNRTLLSFLSRRFASYGVAVKTQEDLGESSDAKEAVAFALMADLCVRGHVNSLPGVTGAKKASVMGKISIPG